MKYSYSKEDTVPDNFILEFTDVWSFNSIADPNIRYPFTRKVIERYDVLYNGKQKNLLIKHLNSLATDATTY